MEHLACSFAVTRCDQRRMEIEIAVLVEIGVDRHRHVMTDTEDCTKRVRTRTQMRDCAQELHRQTFLLQRIFLRISRAIYLEVRQLDLNSLTCTLALYQDTRRRDTRTGRHGFETLLIKFLQIHYDLDVLNRRAVVERDERHAFVAATATNPSSDVDLCPEIGALQCVYDYCSLHIL